MLYGAYPSLVITYGFTKQGIRAEADVPMLAGSAHLFQDHDPHTILRKLLHAVPGVEEPAPSNLSDSFTSIRAAILGPDMAESI